MVAGDEYVLLVSERGNLRTSDKANMDARQFVPQMDSPGRLESHESRSWIIVIVLPHFHSVPCVDPQWAKGLLESLAPDRFAIDAIASSGLATPIVATNKRIVCPKNRSTGESQCW